MRRAVGVRSDLAELAQFLVALLVLSVPLWVLGAFVGSLPAPLNALPVSALSAFLPGLASLLAVLRSRNVRALLAPLRAPRGHVGWWLASSTVFSVPVYAAGMLTGGAWPELSAGQVVGLAVAFLAAALGEELGWTTFALPRLLRVTGSPLRAWMALTGVWALVHLIPYLQTGNDLGWVAAQTVQLALMRAAVVALALGSGDRGWLPVVTHGAYNMAWTTAPGTYHPWLVDLLAAPMVAAAVMAAAVAVRRLPARAYR